MLNKYKARHPSVGVLMTIKKWGKKRRSASNFLPDNPISTTELNEIFELVKLGPSAFNLQHAKYVVVLDLFKGCNKNGGKWTI